MHIPLQFSTRSLLISTTIVGLMIALLSGMMARSLSLLAQNLLLFYINCAMMLALAIGLTSAIGHNRRSVVVATGVGLAAASLLIWSICLLDEKFVSFAGLQILPLLPVAWIISRSQLLIQVEEECGLDDVPHSTLQLKKAAQQRHEMQDSKTANADSKML